MQHFKTSKDILVSHLEGPIQLMKYVKHVCDDESEIDVYTKNSFKQLFVQQGLNCKHHQFSAHALQV